MAIEHNIDDHVVSSNRDERIVMSPAVGMKINVQGTATPTTPIVRCSSFAEYEILHYRIVLPTELHMNYRDRITIEPGKRGGKPCIRGLRVTVYDVLEYLASGMTSQEIVDDFPELELDDIHACLAFAADRERHIGELHAV